VPRAEELVDALAAADAAMYDAKQRGGGVVLADAAR
jgi:GGDEF domain-containing protein